MEYILPLLALLGFLFYWFNRSFFRHGLPALRAPKNAELVQVLLDLEEEPLERLMNLYEQEFGEGPARYARQTYEKWKSGKVRPNKQTFRRFLINLPKVMSFDLKCEVLRKLREAYCARDEYKLTVYTNDWKQKLTPLVEALVTDDKNTELPAELQRRLSWLAEDDAQLANALLHRSQRQQRLHALTLLDKELYNIQRLLDKAGGRGKVTHRVRLPYGNIILMIKRS
jgi:hypothetical protein